MKLRQQRQRLNIRLAGLRQHPRASVPGTFQAGAIRAAEISLLMVQRQIAGLARRCPAGSRPGLRPGPPPSPAGPDPVFGQIRAGQERAGQREQAFQQLVASLRERYPGGWPAEPGLASPATRPAPG